MISHPNRYLSRVAPAAIAVLGLLILLVGPSYADADPAVEADAAAAQFQGDQHVYVSPEAGQQVDPAVLQEAIGSDPIYIAVVPPNTSPSDVASQIRTSLQREMTLVVVSGSEYTAQSNSICSDQALPLLDDAAANFEDDRKSGELTAWLGEYVAAVQGAPGSADAACDGGEASSGIGSTVLWLCGALLLAAGGAYLWLRREKAKHSENLSAETSRVQQVIDQLEHAMQTTNPADNEQAAAALLDADERHRAAVEASARAEDAEDLDAAMLAAAEGLTAVRYARSAVGARIDFEIPQLPAPEGEQLEQEQIFVMGDHEVIGVPDYAPGAQFFHPGDGAIPGGWYTYPVWDTEFIGSVIDEPDGTTEPGGTAEPR